MSRNGHYTSAAVVEGKETSVIVSFVSQDAIAGKPIDSAKANRHEWYPYGDDNLLPQKLLTLIYDNDIMPELLEKKASFMVGQGIMPAVEKLDAKGKPYLDPVIDPRFKAFALKHDLQSKLVEVAQNIAFFRNYAIEGIMTADKKALDSFQVLHFNEVRAEYKSKAGKILNYYQCADWKNAKYDADNEADGTVTKISAYDALEVPKKWVFHGKINTVGNSYYSIPNWYGLRNWLKLANQIPLWHLSGMANGYNIRWHVEIPESYFDKFGDEVEKQKAKDDIMGMLKDFLSGVDNVGKSFVSYFNVNASGQTEDGWKITPLEFDLHDEAFTKLYENSFQAITSGAGVNPSIAGVMFPGKMGAGSGAEIRNAYNIHIALNTVIPRKAIIDMMNVFKKIEGWPEDWEWAFKDFNLSTIDNTASGMSTTTTPA